MPGEHSAFQVVHLFITLLDQVTAKAGRLLSVTAIDYQRPVTIFLQFAGSSVIRGMYCIDDMAVPVVLVGAHIDHDGILMVKQSRGFPWRNKRDLAQPLSEFAAGPAAAPLEEMSLEEVETFLIKKALAKFAGNVSQAAQALGLSRSALYRRLQRYGL